MLLGIRCINCAGDKLMPFLVHCPFNFAFLLRLCPSPPAAPALVSLSPVPCEYKSVGAQPVATHSKKLSDGAHCSHCSAAPPPGPGPGSSLVIRQVGND